MKPQALHRIAALLLLLNGTLAWPAEPVPGLLNTGVAASGDRLPPIAAPLLENGSDLAPPAPATDGYRCGASVAVDHGGQTIVVGSPGDSALAPLAGAAHVLDAKGRVLARLVPDGARAEWDVGSQVAISSGGRWIAVRTSRMPFTSPVAVVLFERVVTPVARHLPFDSRIQTAPVTNWVQRTVLESPNLDRSFGAALAFKNTDDAFTVLAVGAPLDQGGQVHLYEVRDGVWSGRGPLAVANRGPFDEFGTAVSFYGDQLVVGAPHAGGGRGAVHLFQVRSNPWEAFQVQKLDRQPAAVGDRFGESVAFVSSGDLLVGAPGTVVISGPVIRNAGQVDLFQQDGNEFQFRGRLQESNPSPGARFGARVGGQGVFLISAPGPANGISRVYLGDFLDGSAQLRSEVPNPFGSGNAFGAALAGSAGNNPTLVLGVPGASAASGAVVITQLGYGPNGQPQFTRQDGGQATPAIFARGQQFGGAMAVDENTLVVGMPQERTTGRWRGAAYVYERENGEWRLTQRLVGDDGVPHADFGTAVALHRNRLAIGAPSVTSVSQRRGAVFVFERVDGVWQRQGAALEGRDDTHEAWGAALALWDSRLAVGAPGTAGRRGRVVTLQQDSGGQWAIETELASPAAGTTNAFGAALALRDDTLIVGEPGGVGGVHVYQYAQERWSREASLAAKPGSVETAETQRGSAFGSALAYDGHYLAVGQPDMPDTRLQNGAVSARQGRVHLFTAADGWAWAQSLSAGRNQDRFGEALAINGDNLLVGAPGAQRTYLYQRTEALGWTQEFPGGEDFLTGTLDSESGAAVALGEDHLLVANPAAKNGDLGTGSVTPYRLNFAQADRVAEYVRDLLYPRRNAPGGVRARDNAAFNFLAKLYAYDPEDAQRRVKILPNAITNLWTGVHQARADDAEQTLLEALGTLYAAGQSPGAASVKPVEELLLDLSYERSVAESLIARHWLRAVERQRLEGHPSATGFVIDLEIPEYRRIVEQEGQALAAYFRLFRVDLLPGRPDLGSRIFKAWVPSRNLRSPTYTAANGAEQFVAGTSQLFSEGYQDLIMLYGLLRDRAEHSRTLVELLWAQGTTDDLGKARAELSGARQGLFLHSALLADLIPNPTANEEQANGLAEARAGVTRELNRLEALQTQLDLGLNPLGYDPTMLLLYQRSDKDNRHFNSFESFLDFLRDPESDSPLKVAVAERSSAIAAYETYRDRSDQFEHHVQLYNTAYDDRLFDIWGKHRKDIRDGEDPRSITGGGIWSAWQSVLEARNRLQRGLTEITNLHERITIEVDRRGKEKAINNAIGRVHIRFANRQAELTETLGHIEAAQAGFDNLMESLSAENITKGGVVVGLLRGAGNAAAEEAKGRFQAQKERLAGLEQAEVIGLEDQLLDATSKAMIKNLLLDSQAALLDCEQADILLEQSLGQYQALLDEGYDLFNRIQENNQALSGRYFADPIHALRSQRGLAVANLTFAETQRWVFFLARALEYKWNEQFKFDHAGRRDLSIRSLFRARNAKELNDLVNAFVAYDQVQQPQRTQGEPFDYFSVREDFFGYKRIPGDAKVYTDPITGAPTDALGAFRSRLRQSLRDGRIVVRFNTVRTKGNFFLGPEFCEAGIPKSPRHRGTYLNKIAWMAVRLRVATLGPDEDPATGTLTYGGTSYLRNRETGRLTANQPDLVQDEMTSYPVRRWFQSEGKWKAEDGLVISTLTMPKYAGANRPDGINANDVAAAERITAFKERPVAATAWLVDIRADTVNLDALEDIYICFGHVTAERTGPTCGQ